MRFRLLPNNSNGPCMICISSCVCLAAQSASDNTGLVVSSGGCKPRYVSEPFQPSMQLEEDDVDNPNVFYVPACTDVMRCSGCCDYSPHMCSPHTLQTVRRQVKECTKRLNRTELKFWFISVQPCSCAARRPVH